MRKLILLTNLTLDGYMAGPHCELDWHFGYWTEEMAHYVGAQLARADTIILGRVTYTAMAEYWTAAATDQNFSREDLAFAAMMNSHEKIVFSGTLVTPVWSNSRIVNSDVYSYMNDLKKKDGRDMLIFGSGKLATSLIAAGLVDEFNLWIHPVILGKGKSLFQTSHKQTALALRNVQVFNSGVIAMEYTSG